MKNIPDLFQQRLKLLRTAIPLSQTDFAAAIGISLSAIQAYESGSRKPSYEALLNIAEYFDISIDYLVGRTDIQPVNHSYIQPISSESDKIKLIEFKREFTARIDALVKGSAVSSDPKTGSE